MDTNVNPKVSVLMPVYNAESYLREAIDSILSQTFTDFEFLIINDGSTDGSEKVIESYRDPRIRYLSNKKNLGLVYTLNKGIALAQGEYIARMDADDISLPERFGKQVKFMDSHLEVGACGTSYRYFGDKDFVETLPSDYRQSYALLASTSCLGHPTSMIRKAVLDRHQLLYEHDYENAEDYALWVRISQVSRLCSLPEPLLLYRWHAANKSKTDADTRLTRGKARALWYELLLGRPMSESESDYLKENLNDWSTFRAGRRLISTVLNDSKCDSLLDREYFGKLVATEWETKSIHYFRFKGLVSCLLKPSFHKWSHATTIGLVVAWLGKWGLKIK